MKKENINETPQKTYKLSHPLMFAIVMQDEELCKELLNRILPERKVKEVRFPDGHNPKTIHHEIEKALIAGLDAKSIRLDVLFEDDSSRYDIELQLENTHELPKRSRYYHAVMAVNDLKKGSRYSSLKPCYVIFICPFDLMGRGEPVYRFQMLDQKNHLPLGDEQYTLLVNTKSRSADTPKELQALYVYLERGEVTEGDPFIRRLHENVQIANENREVYSIMTLAEEMACREEFAREEGHEAGLKEGQELTQKEIALKLKVSGMSDTEISDITGLSPEVVAALKPFENHLPQ